MNRGNDMLRYSKKTLSTQSREYCFIQANTPVETEVGDYTQQWSNTTVDPHSIALLPASEEQITRFDSVNVRAVHLVKMRGEIKVSEENRLLIPEYTRNGVVTKPERVLEIKTISDMQDRGIVKHLICLERRT